MTFMWKALLQVFGIEDYYKNHDSVRYTALSKMDVKMLSLWLRCTT